MIKNLLIILAGLLILAFLYAVVVPNLPRQAGSNFIACTQEAKLCPDGSAVGRTGPNCEFAPCPGE